MNSKLEAKNLPCIFASFAKGYPESELIKRIVEYEPVLVDLEGSGRKRLKFSSINNVDIITIDAIYESRHLKYVSVINLTTSAIKYLLARSKMIVDIDNHITSLLFLTFDNEQKGQKNYLDRGYNTVVFHTVTSFVTFNYDQSNNVQDTDPWLHFEPSKKQYEELFNLTSGMENEIHKELTNYLSSILEELRIKKNQEKNMIDELVHCQSQTGYMKKYTVCQTSNIDNKKRVCLTCHNKLLTISEINQQFDEPSYNVNIVKKSIDIHPYMFEDARLVEENESPESDFPKTEVSELDQDNEINKNQITNTSEISELTITSIPSIHSSDPDDLLQTELRKPIISQSNKLSPEIQISIFTETDSTKSKKFPETS
ncbi:5509_t:CDS:2 [Diversispora eburnea]|uniref:5509_t:CDS:1 n=1 Tax=Diversispora eburnea TaxID=1213867 RepID=A0A9N9AVU1_9GLOM|nr:5509_t:CDS:2 [Diversispora eburnea]